VKHPVLLPGANREDALIVSITRDGRVIFGAERIRIIDLSLRIVDLLKDRGVERKLYVRADARAKWGLIKEVLNQARAAGIENVAFLVDQ
jgi:biopolymer transport protein TolR